MPARRSRRGRLHGARMIDSYGSRTWIISYSIEESPGEVRHARIGMESMYENPEPGDNIIVTYINDKPTAVYLTD